MKCPKCNTDVEEMAVDVFDHPPCNGFEVSFECPGCGSVFRCYLTANSFVEVG
jgi:transcription initiation factor IIE alpha subunit